MKMKVTKVGNSRAIRLSKVIMQQCNFGDEVKVKVTKRGLLISSLEKGSRDGWDEQFKKAIQEGAEPESAMLGHFENKFDEEEWTWPEMEVKE